MGDSMSGFFWQVIRAALLDGSSRVIGIAAETIAKYVPFTIGQVAAFLESAVEVLLKVGDDWLDTLAASILPPSTEEGFACGRSDCPCEVSDYADLVEAIAAV
jgi:hypothetical protein